MGLRCQILSAKAGQWAQSRRVESCRINLVIFTVRDAQGILTLSVGYIHIPMMYTP
jgi:hypothetical protein